MNTINCDAMTVIYKIQKIRVINVLPMLIPSSCAAVTQRTSTETDGLQCIAFVATPVSDFKDFSDAIRRHIKA